MASRDRERELARAHYERQQANRRSAEEQRRRRNAVVAAVLAVAVVLGAVVWLALARDGGSELAAVPDPGETAAQDPAAESPPAEDEAAAPPGICPDATPTSAADQTYDAPPEDVLTEGADYVATLATNCGDIVIDLVEDAAPATVGSFVFLAEEGYFDSTACHRLTTTGIQVLQCGDPTGTGTGGPGYTLPDENLPEDEQGGYPVGTVAMANTGQPGTGGSQFFIVYGDTPLPPLYTVFGTVTEGLDIVQEVAEAGLAPGSDVAPAQPVVIEDVEITEQGT